MLLFLRAKIDRKTDTNAEVELQFSAIYWSQEEASCPAAPLDKCE